MLLSSFELLCEPITPKTPGTINPTPTIPDPVIVQAYFVLISNVGDVAADLTLTFTSSLSLRDTFTVFDLENQFFMPHRLNFISPVNTYTKGTVQLSTLEPGETGLFLLQPDIKTLLQTPNPFNFAARGYAEVASSSKGAQCLITPQIRGTFFNINASTTPPTLTIASEESYPLPVPDGNLFEF